MNICILLGKLIEDIDFRFVYNDKIVSMSVGTMELQDNAMHIKIYGENDMADYMYRSLKREDNILIYGRIHTTSKNVIIEVIYIEKICNMNKHI